MSASDDSTSGRARCQPWAPDWTWPGHQWPGQRHPWADLDPLGRDRQPLPSLAPVRRVLAPCQIRLDAGIVPIDDTESYIDIALRDHLIAEARRER